MRVLIFLYHHVPGPQPSSGRLRDTVQLVLFILCSAILTCLSACIPPAVAPMPTRVVSAQVAGTDTPVLIYLPGMGDSITVFEANGMLDSLHAAGLDVEFVACDAHFGYYAKRNLHERVQNDVIRPEVEKGRTAVWLVGNSMGGLGSLLYAWKHPGTVTGVVLLGPFISRGGVVREIKVAGGLEVWDPVIADTTDWQRQLWLWLKHCAVGNDSSCPVIFLGYGRDDGLAPGQKLLAEILQAEHVVALEGGHDWPVWRKAWGELLHKGALR